MNVKELIERLQQAVDHGQNPEAKVLAWNPDIDEWAEVTVLSLATRYVHIYTDEP